MWGTITALKAHCHAIFCCVLVKMRQIVDKVPLFKHKITLRTSKKKITSDFFKEEQAIISFSAIFPRHFGGTGKNWPIFQVAIYFHPGHPQSKLTDTSFCALVEYLLTKLDHYL